MPSLTQASEIQTAIAKLAAANILWIDTEIADWQTSHPRISLIQVLADPKDTTGKATYILDVLDRPELVKEFIHRIIANPQIEKIFHNAAFDLQYLGKTQAKNVTCTLQLARQMGRHRLGVSNLKLKTLAAELCGFSHIDSNSQQSDWGKRPLSQSQFQYATLDPVYLAWVHQHLLSVLYPDRDRKETWFMSGFSVTDVRIAFECPRLFYLQKNIGGNTLFIPAENAHGIGKPFHELAKELVDFIANCPECQAVLEPDRPKVETVAQKIQDEFYKNIFFPYLQQHPDQGNALLSIWSGLRGLIKHYAELLVANRQDFPSDRVIAETFIDRELDIQDRFQLPDGTTEWVRGTFDSLVKNRDRLCAVEYKTYQPADPTAQLAQVALYSYMLAQQKNVPVDAAVYCVLPEFHEYYYPWERLQDSVYEIIPSKLQQMRDWLQWEPPQSNPPPQTSQPHLCEICPQRETCQTYFRVEEIPEKTYPPSSQPTSNPVPPSPPPHLKSDSPSSVPIQEADELGKQLVETFEAYNIDVDYKGAAVGPAFIRIKLKPKPGVKVSSLMTRSPDLQVQLGIASPPLIAPQPGYVSIDLPRRDRQVANLYDRIGDRVASPSDPVRIAIGVDLNDNLIEADLSDANTCHFLVGGTTGSGKSEFLRSLLLSLLYRYPSDRLKIALVDPKRVTFPEFEDMPWLLSPVVKDSDRAIKLMEDLVAEMERRYQLFEAARCSQLTQYNRKSDRPEPPIVCIFDEYADFMAEKDTRDALELYIKRLGAMARAAGIHLIVATQRPEARVVTPIIRSNLPGRIALRTASDADSKIILGTQEASAAYLLGKGDLLYQVGANLQRLQSLFAPEIQLPKWS
ncbi:DNA translocase FtsK [Geitlerinema sp. PCC 9228]|uniref:DNA translocase FtsK n=1 Tax=Geitlerinema sp. PCC 9228 TaxID=111611 RepID=UPI0008F9DC7C|nr:DNA translocase FtsK [Geitlerinema sp. PCC 9228]